MNNLNKPRFIGSFEFVMGSYFPVTVKLGSVPFSGNGKLRASGFPMIPSHRFFFPLDFAGCVGIIQWEIQELLASGDG